MTNDIETLIKYVRASIHNIECNHRIIDEKTFFYNVYENGLIGLVFNHIDSDNVSLKLYEKLNYNFLAYIQKDIKQRSLILKINNIFNENNIKHIFLKGAHLKSLYPESYMRGMGDIDILIKPTDLEAVHKLFNDNDLNLYSRSIAHDVFKDTDGLMIEIHPGFNVPKEDKFTKILANPWGYAKKELKCQYTFDPAYELVYLVYHLAKHMYSGGIGIRSVLDIGVYLNHFNNDINEELLKELLLENDLAIFYNYLLYINNDLFDYTFEIDSNDELSDVVAMQLIELITTSGIHGSGASHNPFVQRVVTNNKKQSKIRFILSRTFPNYKAMTGLYPSLTKAPFLLPVYWLIRLFKLVFLKGRTNMKKLKLISRVEDKKDLEKLFRNIGL